MSQFEKHLNESLSALIDNEASDLEVRRILKELEMADASQVAALREKWRTYNTTSALMRGASISKIDLSESIREAIKHEDSLKQTIMSNVASVSGRFAIAASVAVFSILGVQELNQDYSLDGEAAKFTQIDESAVNQFAGPVNQIPFSVRVPQEGSLSTVSAEGEIQKQYSDRQMRAYVFYILSKHSAVSSDLSGHGILPYSRIEERQNSASGER
jgi:sigma-E factor negative regulatory protein RseA